MISVYQMVNWTSHVWWAGLVLTAALSGLAILAFKIVDGAAMWGDGPTALVWIPILVSLVAPAFPAPWCRRIQILILMGIVTPAVAWTLAFWVESRLIRERDRRYFYDHGFWLFLLPPLFATGFGAVQWLAPSGSLLSGLGTAEWCVGLLLIVPSAALGLHLALPDIVNVELLENDVERGTRITLALDREVALA
jgi:hypothetical protein